VSISVNTSKIRGTNRSILKNWRKVTPVRLLICYHVCNSVLVENKVGKETWALIHACNSKINNFPCTVSVKRIYLYLPFFVFTTRRLRDWQPNDRLS
jgi:hypothetical protein